MNGRINSILPGLAASMTATSALLPNPAMLPRICAGRLTSPGPAIISYGDGYSPSPGRMPQIDPRHVGGISDPFAQFGIPIGDRAPDRDEFVGVPGVDDAKFYTDPNSYSVQPVLDPSVGVERMIDPQDPEKVHGMWAVDDPQLWIIGLTSLVAATTVAGIGVSVALVRSLNRAKRSLKKVSSDYNRLKTMVKRGDVDFRELLDKANENKERVSIIQYWIFGRVDANRVFEKLMEDTEDKFKNEALEAWLEILVENELNSDRAAGRRKAIKTAQRTFANDGGWEWLQRYWDSGTAFADEVNFMFEKMLHGKRVGSR